MRTYLRVIPAATTVWFGLSIQPGQAQQNGAEWPTLNRDLAATRYSPLTQINTKNVEKLSRAWVYKVGRLRNAGTITGGSEVVPIVVTGVMYLTTSDAVVALEPETGREIWRYETKPGTPSRRGVAYWPGDRNNPPRIVFTTGSRMIALNAKTGKVDPGFGREGQVEMTVPYDSAPLVYKNLLFVGAHTGEAPATGEPGNTRAYDARTGAKLWEFHSVPEPGEEGHETWEGDSWKDRSGVNNWGFSMTVDSERGILYTVLGGPNTNYWGGDRKGNDLFGNSVVALDANTGKLRWYFQAVHHDVFDYDLPPSPGLLDVTVNGRKVSDSGANRQDRIHVHPGPCHGKASLRYRRKARATEQGSGRAEFADAADSRKAAAPSSRELQAGRHRNRRGYKRRTCEVLPRPGGAKRRSL